MEQAMTDGFVTIATEGSRALAGYLARPDRAPAHGIVVLSDMFGLNKPIRDIADRYAQRGHLALVPNLFWRSGNPGVISYDDANHAEAWERLKALDLDATTGDIGRAAAWLRAEPSCTGKVAAIGFCGGGRLAYLAAARAGVNGAAALYGLGIASHLDELAKVNCPLQLHYGLNDQHIPRQEIDAVAAGLRGSPIAQVFLYPEAGHSFANPVRPTYDPAAAALAFERIDRMLANL
jgi:carboxymethylenebutenolidase